MATSKLSRVSQGKSEKNITSSSIPAQSINKVANKSTNKSTKKLSQTERNVKEVWSFTKYLIFLILLNCEIQIYLSYILAYMGRDNIAETLSVQVVTIGLGSIVFYLIKSTIENLSKYTNLFGKKSTKKQKSNVETTQQYGVEDEVEEPLDAGITSANDFQSQVENELDSALHISLDDTANDEVLG